MPKLSARTADRVRILESRSDLNQYERYYFGYQYGLGAEYIVPYLEKHGVSLKDSAICEIGCGEGGVLAALAEAGPKEVVGIDIRQSALDSAQKTFDALDLKAQFAIHDIT